MTMIYNSYAETKAALTSGEATCQSIVKNYLSNIKANTALNAFVEVYETEALEQARALDEKYKSNPGQIGKLFGMVVGIKDNLCYKNHEVNAASKILKGFKSLFSATAIERLLAEDAIIIGRLNCDEFAMGAANETSIHGPVKNAVDTTRVPGGSSGGSAVAVQAKMCLIALGSDTGGSIRQPAAFCGVIGLKPTYGRISRYGLLAYASSFDQIGPITNTVADAALALEVMAGADDYDSTLSSKSIPALSQKLSKPGKSKIAYLKTALEYSAIDPAIKAQTEATLKSLEAAGHEIVGIDLPLLDYLIPTYYVLTTAEASSNLARYDGVHYGYRSDTENKESDLSGLEQIYRQTRTEGFGQEVKRRIMLGTFVLSAGYYDAYYSKAQKVRRLVQDSLIQLFEEVDYLVLPTTPTPAFKLGEKPSNPVERYLADIFTVIANIAGNPAISIPLKPTAEGLPIGFQIIAKSFEEEKLLAFSKYLVDELV